MRDKRVVNGDLEHHLKHLKAAIDKGSDLGDGAWDTDIDNRDRHTEGDTWDVGADEYVAAAAGVIKTYNGLAWASVKTIDGVAVASVKTINGAAAQ